MGGIGSGRKKFVSDDQKRLKAKRWNHKYYLKNKHKHKEWYAANRERISNERKLEREKLGIFKSVFRQVSNEIKNEDVFKLLNDGLAHQRRKVWKQLNSDYQNFKSAARMRVA